MKLLLGIELKGATFLRRVIMDGVASTPIGACVGPVLFEYTSFFHERRWLVTDTEIRRHHRKQVGSISIINHLSIESEHRSGHQERGMMTQCEGMEDMESEHGHMAPLLAWRSWCWHKNGLIPVLLLNITFVNIVKFIQKHILIETYFT